VKGAPPERSAADGGNVWGLGSCYAYSGGYAVANASMALDETDLGNYFISASGSGW
jgi:hypothetical protein